MIGNANTKRHGDVVFARCVADTILRASDAAAGRMILSLCKIQQKTSEWLVVYVTAARVKADGEIAFSWELRAAGDIV